MRALAVVFSLLLAGCGTAPEAPGPATGPGTRTPPLRITPDPWQGEVVPEAPSDLASNPQVLTDHATLVYTAPEAPTMTLRIRPAALLLDAAGGSRAGFVAEVAYGEYRSKAYLDEPPVRFGLGPCLGPLWSIRMDPDHGPRASFFPSELGMPGLLPGFVLLPRVDPSGLATRANVSALYREPEDYERYLNAWTPFPYGPARLGAVQAPGAIQTTWIFPYVLDNATTLGTSGGWEFADHGPGTVPSWVQGPRMRANYTLTRLLNTGEPLPTCETLGSAPAYDGPWMEVGRDGTAEEPPLPYSFRLALARAMAEPFVAAYLAAYPDAYLHLWAYHDSAPGEATFSGYWTFHWSRPGEPGHVGVYCLGAGARDAKAVVPATCLGTSDADWPEKVPRLAPGLRLAPYSHLFAVFDAYAGTDPCSFTMRLQEIHQGGVYGPTAQLGCEGFPGVQMDASTGLVESIHGPLPAPFVDPFR